MQHHEGDTEGKNNGYVVFELNISWDIEWWWGGSVITHAPGFQDKYLKTPTAVSSPRYLLHVHCAAWNITTDGRSDFIKALLRTGFSPSLIGLDFTRNGNSGMKQFLYLTVYAPERLEQGDYVPLCTWSPTPHSMDPETSLVSSFT